MPLISIIMPVYNKEKYVCKAIKSVLNQRFTDFELIIINDGSSDKSLEKCRLFNDDRIKIISVENGGVSKARNIGLDNAAGEYVTFVDADDYIDPFFLDKIYIENSSMVIGGLTKVSENHEIIGFIRPRLAGKMSIDAVVKTFYKEQILSGIYGFVGSKLVKRKIIEDNSIRFDEGISLAEDFEFFLKVYRCVDYIHFISDSLYYYVQNANNSAIAMTDDKINFFEQIQIQIKTKDFLVSKDSFDRDENDLYLERVTGYVYTILMHNSSNFSNFKKSFKRLKKYVPNVKENNNGLMRIIIILYQNNNLLMCYILLKIKLLLRG